MSKQDRTPSKFKRGGLHRLECASCPTYGYYTVAMLEDAGLPVCWRRGCGDTLMPTEVELALMMDLDDSPLVVAWREMTHGKELSQQRSVGWERAAERRAAGTLNRMDAKALDEMRAERSRAARARRLNALMPVAEPMAF
jgi:hypothetical protein